jgi:HEAT repeat protein
MIESELANLINVMLDDTIPDEGREATALAIGALGDSALSKLQELLQTGDADQRWWAARALAALGTPSAISLLVETLSDPDPDLRACAALGLGALAAPEAARPLAALLADESAYVGRIAGNALLQIGAPAVPALIEALRSESPAARAGAARAFIPLAEHGHDAIPALFAALDDDSALVTYYAEEALWRMGVGMVLVKP